MNTLCIQTLNHNCYCCNAILVYSWFNNLEWRRFWEILYSLAEGCENKIKDFTFQTLAYFKYTQEKVKNEWRQNCELFEILTKVSSKFSWFATNGMPELQKPIRGFPIYYFLNNNRFGYNFGNIYRWKTGHKSADFEFSSSKTEFPRPISVLRFILSVVFVFFGWNVLKIDGERFRNWFQRFCFFGSGFPLFAIFVLLFPGIFNFTVWILTSIDYTV